MRRRLLLVAVTLALAAFAGAELATAETWPDHRGGMVAPGISQSGGPFTGPLLGPLGGTCAAPVYAFSGDADTGLASYGAGTWALCANATQVLTSDALGVAFPDTLGIVWPGSGAEIRDNGSDLLVTAGGDLLVTANVVSADLDLTVAGLLSTASVQIGNGTAIAKHLSAQASLDFDFSAAGITCQDLTITVTGAAAGNTCSIGLATTLGTGVLTSCWISAANTCTVRACDVTSANGNPAAQTIRCDVWQH